MATSPRMDYAGFLIQAGGRQSRVQAPVSPSKYIYTWQVGYRESVAEARAFAKQGRRVKLVKLASQPFPNANELADIRQGGWPLLAVVNEFAPVKHGSTPDSALAAALEQAERQYQEGFGRTRMAMPGGSAASQSKTEDETSEDEKREFLRAMYGDGRDDGVR